MGARDVALLLAGSLVAVPSEVGSAAALILVHNHPSGDAVPSAEGQAITTCLR